MNDISTPTTVPQRPLRVFLCHSSADKPAVRELYQRLKADGFEPWLDEEDLLPGQDWQREIPRAVRASDVVIVCLSHGSVNRAGYIQKEIKFALDVADEQPDGTIFIIPVKLEDCEVAARLNRWQWVNLFESSGYKKLVRALQFRAKSLSITLAERPEESVVPRHQDVETSQSSSAVSNQSGGVDLTANDVAVGQDVVGRDKIVQEGDKVNRDKIVQYIQYYDSLPTQPEEPAYSIALRKDKASSLSDRALTVIFGVMFLIGLLISIPLASNLFSPQTGSAPTLTLTNAPIPTAARVLPSPPPIRLRPAVTDAQSLALGDAFVTIREISGPGDLAQESVILMNIGAKTNLVGWTLADGEGQKFTFADTTLLTNAEVRLHTASGINSPTDLYWGQPVSLWNVSGTVAYLRDANGRLMSTYRVP